LCIGRYVLPIVLRRREGERRDSSLLRLCSTRFVPYAILHAAMSEKLAVVRRWVELYNERTDVTEFLSLLDPEVELQTPGGPRLRGHDQARGWFEKELENVRSRIIPDRFVEAGDVVAGLGREQR
jgi:SnoaL-like protein